MKKSLKLVAIFIAVLIVVVVGGTSGYILISNNQTYYIYDLRLVEPLENVGGYIYNDENVDYVKIDNKKVYLKDADDDYFNVGVYANTSNNSNNIEYHTSNSGVAYFDRSVAGELRVKYVGEGNATLSVSIGSVSSSFDITVFNLVPSNFQVFDYEYYGKYAEETQFINLVNTYSDSGTTYYYNYKVDATEDANGNLVGNENINNANLRVDYFDDTLFENVSINETSKQLVLTCKSGVSTGEGTTQVIVQAFYENKGTVSVVDSYVVNVKIESNKPEFLQVELSSSPNFDENVFFVDAQNMADVEEEQILQKFDQYVKYQKTETYLHEKGETPIYNAYFTDQVDRVYLRFRTVYTNGQVASLLLGDELTCNNGNEYLKPTYFKDSYYLELKKGQGFDGSNTFRLSMNLTKDGVTLSHTFEFKYYELNQNFINTNSEDDFWNFYSYDVDTNTYEYIYWDIRAKSKNAITKDGKICGFGDLTLDLSRFEPAASESETEESTTDE